MSSARPDTRYLADSASLITDDSQRATNLTASGSGGYESISARARLDGSGRGRSVEASIEATDTNSGVIVDYGTDGGDPNYQILVDGGAVRFLHDGGAIATVDLPNVSGTARTFILAWNTEPNPATTGLGDELRSEFVVYDVDGAELSTAVVEHDRIPILSDLAFGVGGAWDGGSFGAQYDGTINAVRLSARFHTRVEVREHWVAQTAAPSVSGITAVEWPVLPADVCLAGALAGPQYQAAAAAMQVGRNRHRLIGPVIQCFTPSSPTWGADLSTTAPATWVRTLIDGYQVMLGWVWRRKIPRHTEWLRGLVQWATWVTSGTLVSVKIRVYCASAPPGQAAEWSAVTLSRTTDDGVGGLGVLEEFENLRVRRDAEGYSWIWVGIDVDVAPGNTNAFVVREIAVAPYSKPAADGQPPNQWGP